MIEILHNQVGNPFLWGDIQSFVMDYAVMFQHFCVVVRGLHMRNCFDFSLTLFHSESPIFVLAFEYNPIGPLTYLLLQLIFLMEGFQCFALERRVRIRMSDRCERSHPRLFVD